MQEVIILDLDGVLIEVMLSFLNRVEDLESTSSIIIKSGFVDVKNEILTPMPPHMAFNVVSSWTSNFTQVYKISASFAYLLLYNIYNFSRLTHFFYNISHFIFLFDRSF